MILQISDVKSEEVDVMTIGYELLSDQPVHLFIASNIWEKLTVKLSEDIPLGVLKYIILRCKEKEVILPTRRLSSKEISLLCEMYPDKAGLLRKMDMLGRDVSSLV